MISFLVHILVLCSIYIILAVGCNFILGYGGMIQMGHGAFFAIGAYAAAILSTRTSIPWIPELLISMALALAVGLVLAWTMVPLDPDFFSLATFGFTIVVVTVLMNWTSVTSGAAGIPGIPGIELGTLHIRRGGGFLMLAGILAAASMWLVYLLVRSSFGRALRAMRDDDIGFEATGRSAARAKVYAYGLGAMLAGLGGNLYAHYISYIDPTSVGVDLSFLVLTMVVVGGVGTFAGPIVGTVLLVVFPETLRFVGLPASVGGLIRQALYGFLLVVILFFRPAGLMGGLNWGKRPRWLRFLGRRPPAGRVGPGQKVAP
jgi:branched-chain amino acid transport system permease protein